MKRSLPAVDPDSDSNVPVKVMRIIDITPDHTKDDLTNAFQCSTNLKPSELQENIVDYVYDLYRLEKRHTVGISSRSPSPGSRLRLDSNPKSVNSCPKDEVVYDQDFSDDEERIYVDDEDDSNSESNWRNDYPDEEDVSTSESSSASHSNDSDSHSDSDVDDLYYRSSHSRRFYDL